MERVFTGLTIKAGKSYIDGHGDTNGPMELRDGVWLNPPCYCTRDTYWEPGSICGPCEERIEEAGRQEDARLNFESLADTERPSDAPLGKNRAP